MTRLIIARHGNTFRPDEAPTRVGARTDLPLVESGENQARALGQYFNSRKWYPDTVYSSALQRTRQTAKLILDQFTFKQPVFALDIFNEIDYGPDENRPEHEVIARIGEQAIQDWDDKAVVPDGWLVDPAAIIQNWIDFAKHMAEDHSGETILVVTSNGTARFAPYITGDYDSFRRYHNIKLKTGAFGVFEFSNDGLWRCAEWGTRP